MGTCLSILELVLKSAEAVNSTTNNNDYNNHKINHNQTAGAGGSSTGSNSNGDDDVFGTSKTSPIYSDLPHNAEKQFIRNIYDGDTLTLKDERRVRFLGVDTPELKENQPFAHEAKNYTQSVCRKDHPIYIVVNEKDHYGRLLAWVYVEQPNGSGYLCVNEGLIHQGYAYCYTTNKDSKPSNWSKLLQLQVDARKSKRGLWKSFVDASVVATSNGSAYHKESCMHVSNSRNLRHLTVSEATDLGLHPCRTCIG